MKKFEYALIYQLRNGTVKANMTQQILVSTLGQLSQDEMNKINTWKQHCNYIIHQTNINGVSSIDNIDYKTIKYILELYTEQTFPLPISFLPTKNRNAILISYYTMNGFDISELSFDNKSTNDIIKPNKYEMYYILTKFRKEKIPSNVKVSVLTEKIGLLDDNESEAIKKWREILSMFNNIYPEYTVNSLTTYLGMRTKHNFPIPSGLVDNNKVVLSYYHMNEYDVNRNDKTYTQEQQSLFNPNISGIVVINAGPGTGKTTVANHRAYLMKQEGVLLISYTNEAINENYNRLKEYPDTRGKLCKKKYDKSINIVNVTTVDSLANHISKTKSNIGEGYDSTIVNATLKLNNIDSKIKRYKHIIVDEAQDIDDSRGMLILEYFKASGAKSLCIFGDPRQRIHENNGGWYTKLWTGGNSFSNVPVYKIGFSYSYRFQNRMHLAISNHLSSNRPEIHHQLMSHPSVPEYASTPIYLFTNKYKELDEDISFIANFILKELHEKRNVQFSDIAVIGASMNKDNATSDLAGKICSVFKDNNIPCYTRQEGAFIPNAILFTTIHSVKGKEFDYVFIFGADSYPETFKNIPYESAESLIYVMHTRARKQMFYISPKREKFTPPRGLRNTDPKIKDKFIKPSELLTDKPFSIESDSILTYKISDLSTEHSLGRFLETNDYNLEMGYISNLYKPSKDSEITKVTKLPDRPEYINERFWGVLTGMAVQFQLTGEFHEIFNLYAKKQFETVSDRQYIDMKKKGLIINGTNIKTGKVILKAGMINVLRDDEIVELQIILSKDVKDLIISEIIHLAKVYDFLISGNTQSRYDISAENIKKINVISDSICQSYKDIAIVLIDEYGKCEKVEKVVYDSYMCVSGSIDSFHTKYVLEFKTCDRQFIESDALQVNLYYLCTGVTPILINLQTGNMSYVTGTKTIEQWRYTIKSYSTLRTHVDEVTHKKNVRISRNDHIGIMQPYEFAIDTEFTQSMLYDNSNGFNKGNKPKVLDHIFEIAIVNLKDPYRSIVQTLNPIFSDKEHSIKPGNKSAEDKIVRENINFAVDWIHEPRELFNYSITIDEFKDLFIKLATLLNLATVELEYYMCAVDVNWCKNIPLKSILTDLRSPIQEDANKLGYITNGKSPKLSEYYDVKCTPTDFKKHMRVHTALTDTLMLYELKHLGYIPSTYVAPDIPNEDNKKELLTKFNNLLILQ